MNDLPAEFRLGPWRVQPGAGQISNAKRTVHVPPRLMSLLELLAARPGETLMRDWLIDELWPRGHVNDEALSRAVNELRGLLEDDARQPKYIQTVPKRGYRLVADVEPVGTEPDAETHQRLSQWRVPIVVGGLLVLALLAWRWFTPAAAPPDPLAAAQRITAEPGMEYHPELSPDGNWVVQVVARDGRAALEWRATANPTATRELRHDTGLWSPVFSPRADRLAAIVTAGDECTVVTLPATAEGQAEDHLTELGPCRYPGGAPVLDWSPDGEWLAVVAADAETDTTIIERLWLADGRREALTQHSDPYGFDTRPRIDPTGRWLAFTRGTRSVRELWLKDLDDLGAPARALTADQQYVSGLDWLPGGEALVVASDRDGHRALWRLTLDGEWTLLGARDALLPSVADDGRMAFLVTQYEANIWAVDVETGAPGDAPLIASTKYDSNPSYSPNGRTIAFTSNRTGVGSIWLADADGRRARPAYQPRQGRAVGPHWVDDGQALLATEYRAGDHRVVQIALDRRAVTTVPTEGQRPFGAMASDDGELFYLAGDDTGGVYLWHRLSDRAARQWWPEPVDRFQLADDGHVYFTPLDGEALLRAPASGSGADPERVETIVAALLPWARDDWLVAGGALYYPREDGTVRLDLESGRERLITDWVPTALGPTMAVSPDGETLLMARTDRAESDLFLAEPD